MVSNTQDTSELNPFSVVDYLYFSLPTDISKDQVPMGSSVFSDRHHGTQR